MSAAPALSGRAIRALLWVVVAVAACACALAGTARAQPAHPAYSAGATFGTEDTSSPPTPDQLRAATRIAVNGRTGDIYVTDANNRVAIFRPSGSSATYLRQIGVGILQAPYGVAVDNSNGSVYVSDAGHNRIVRFLSSGGANPTYTRDAGYAGPPLGSGVGQVGSFAAAIAIDQQTHDLVVADPANRVVSRFTSSGAFVGSIDGTEGGGARFATPADVAVGPTGEVYVVDVTGDLYNNGTSLLRRFSRGGGALGRQDNLPTPAAVAADATSGMILAAGDTSFFAIPTLYGFTGDDAAGNGPFPAVESVLGVAIDPRVPQRAYALTGFQAGSTGTVGVQVFDSVVAAGVSVPSVSAITPTSVHLTGTVDPGGLSATPHFEYWDGQTWNALPDLPPVSGSGDHTVQDDLTGLAVNTTYQVRLVATNANTTSTSNPVTFTTAPTAPLVTTGGVTDLDTDSVQVTGSVNPLGQQSQFHFEYGTSTDYGARVPVAADDVAGNGRSARVVTEQIAGLMPGMTYHYRLVAANATGTTSAADATFTTPAAGVVARAFELVSPSDKGGASLNLNGNFQADPTGDGLVYQGTSPVVGNGTASAPLASRFLSTRTTTGWSFLPLDAPQLGGTTQSLYRYSTLAVSEDQSRALVISSRKLADGAADGDGNLYLRDLSTGAYQLIARGSRAFYDSAAGLGDRIYYGGSRDFSTVVFASTFALTPDAPTSSTVKKLYRWASGRLELASLLPGGAPSGDGIVQDLGSAVQRRYVSVDGSRIYYTVGNNQGEGVYLLEPGQQPRAVSESRRAGDPPGAQPGSVLNVSRDGRYAFFVSTGGPLTTDAAAGSGSDLYRYDADAQTLQFVAPNMGSDFGISDDGSSILYSDGFGGPTHLWRDGVDHTLPGATLLGVSGAVGLSPSGRYVAITSYSPLTSDNNYNPKACPDDGNGFYNGLCWEMYRYDSDTGSTVCVSCSPTGELPNGPVNLVDTGFELSVYQPRFVTDNGYVFFDTPTRLVAADTNGTRDVYVYAGGAAHLISPGDAAASARFADIGADGDDVFFTTEQPLVGVDTDSRADMYDARVGGGLPSQVSVSAPAPCRGPECGEASRGPTASPPATSQVAAGATGTPKKPARARVNVVHSSAGATSIRVTVSASTRGLLRVSGAGVTAVSRTAKQAGSYTLTVSYTRAARAARHAHRRVRLRLRITLTPPFVARASTTLNRTLGK